MTRIRAALEAAWISLRWTDNRGRRTATKSDVMRALLHAYKLGYDHARVDGTAAVDGMVGEHELSFDEGETVVHERFD